MKNSLLLISNVADDITFAKEMTSLLGIPMIHADNSKEARDIICQMAAAPVLLVDVSEPQQLLEFESRLGPLIAEKFNGLEPRLVHLVCHPDLVEPIFLKKSNLFNHFVLRTYAENPDTFKEAATYYARVIEAINFRSSTFPTLKDWLSPKATAGSVQQEIRMKNSIEKDDVLVSLQEFLEKKTAFSARAIPVVITAIDELLMNAIYDAPTDVDGDQRFKTLPRNTPIELEPEERIEVQVGYDGDIGAFSVTDHYGSIQKDRLLNQFSKSHVGYHFEVNTKVAGAGIGIAGTLRSGGSIVFVGVQGTRTTVTLIFKPYRKFAEFRNQFRYIATHLTAKAS